MIPNNLKRSQLLKFGAWLFFINGIIAAIFSLKYVSALLDNVSGFTIFYLIIASVGHFVMLLFGLYLVLYLPVCLITGSKKVCRIWASFLCGLFLFLLYIDASVFEIYRFHFYNSFVLELLLGEGAAAKTFNFQTYHFFIVFFALLAVCIAQYYLGSLVIKLMLKKRLRYGIAIGVTVILFIISSNLIHAYAFASGDRQITRVSQSYPFFFPLRANTFLLQKGILDPEKVRDKIQSQDNTSVLDYPKKPIVTNGEPEKNILFILIDSWNHKTMDSVVMPNIYSFSKKCNSFKHHYGGDSRTRMGISSFFYGLPGVYWDAILTSGTTPVFLDLLQEKNCEIKILSTSYLSYPPLDRTVFSKIKNLKLAPVAKGAAAGDLEITQEWIDFTGEYVAKPQEDKKPFFGMVFYDLLHDMELPEGAEELFKPAWQFPKYEKLARDLDPTEFFNLYKNCAHWLDTQVVRILNDLEEKGLLDNTIVIISGDHGQEFNENGNNYWIHGSNFTNYQLQVPFLLYDKDLEPREYNHWTMHYDVSCTLLSKYLHVTNDFKDYSIGKSLFDTVERKWMLVGEPEFFGLVERDQITVINFDRTYDIYDTCFNLLPNAKLNINYLNEALKVGNEYFKK